MILLDTDHINVLQTAEGPAYESFVEKLTAAPDQDLVTTVITLEEQMRGWLALINRARDTERQVPPYERLASMVEFFCQWTILPFDERAAEEFEQLRRQKIRIGTMDLKIAAIALVQEATVLSANLRDFRQVPHLRVEDWLH